MRRVWSASGTIGRGVAVAGVLLACAACGGSDRSAAAPSPAAITIRVRSVAVPASRTAPVATTPARLPTRRSRLVAILPGAHRPGVFGWRAAVAVRGLTAVWISRVAAYHEPGFTITLLRFDQRLTRLALHAGGTQPGGTGWKYGDTIGSRERRIVVGGFNSAFQEGYGAGGFKLEGRVGWPLLRGRASVVIYRDGVADIGRWRATVPARGRPVAAVRQNLGLLIDRGRIAATVDSCIKACWGDPLHEQPIVARSGLGIAPGGDLIWGAGHDLSVRALAEALLHAGAVRAMELDINPAWVAGYVYAHSRRTLTPIALIPGQTPIPGQFLAPYFRDFFTVIARVRSLP